MPFDPSQPFEEAKSSFNPDAPFEEVQVQERKDNRIDLSKRAGDIAFDLGRSWQNAKRGDEVQVGSDTGSNIVYLATKLDDTHASKVDRAVAAPNGYYSRDDVSQKIREGQLSDLNARTRAATTSAAMGLVPAMGGMAGAGAVARIVGSGGFLKGAAALGGGLLGGMGFDLAQRGALDIAAPAGMGEVEAAQAAHPNISLVGGLAGMSPVMGLGGGVNAAGRALGGAIGGGFQGAQELYNGGGSLDEDGLVRIALASVGGAAMAHPTALGEASQNLGAKMANPIVSKLGSVKGGDALPKITANVTDIALATPEPPALPVPQPDAQSLIGLDKAQAGLPERAGAPKAVEAKPDTKVTIPDPETGAPITVDAAGPLGDFEPTEPFIPKKVSDTEVFNRRVKGVIDNLAAEGVEIDRQTAVKLARTTDRKEFNSARQKLIDSIKPPEIPATGPVEKAETKAVSELASEPAKEQPKVAEPAKATTEPKAAPTQEEDFKRYQEIQKEWTSVIDRAKADPTAENIQATADIIGKLGSENEAIKNRYGGMPPEAPTVAPKAEPAFPLAPAEPDSPAPYVDKEGNFVKRGKRGWEIVDPEAGKVLDLVTPTLDAAVQGVGKVNDVLLDKMATADVEATNPNVKLFGAFDDYLKNKDQTPTDAVAFEKPGSGRSPDKETQAINKERYAWKTQMRPVRDSITGNEIPDNIAHNAKIIHEQLIKGSKAQGTVEPPVEVSEHVAQVPEKYQPFLTDIASRLPDWTTKIPGVQSASDMFGTLAKALRKGLGLSWDNIRDVSPRLAGALREYSKFIGDLSNRFLTETKDLGTLARKHLTRDQFVNLEAAALTGDRDAILDTFKGNSHEAELVQAFDRNQAAKDAARQMLIDSGRDVGEVDAYFRRQVIDRKGLLAAFGKEKNLYDDAVSAFTKDRGRPPTSEEQTKLMNDLITGSLRGKGGPGFLKQRTIDVITKDLLKYYEPFDVSDARWASSVANEIGNRKFFGKVDVDPAGAFTTDSSFGKIVQDEVKSGAIRGRGLEMIQENLRDLLSGSARANKAVSDLTQAWRKFQTYAYLADVSTGLVQFADAFSIAREYGVKGALNMYGRNMPKLESLGVHEGHNVDVSAFSRNATSGVGRLAEAPFKWAMKNLIGKADALQKSASTRAATAKVASEIQKPGSEFMAKLDKEYGALFPDRWPAMKKSLASADFAKGILDENSSLFLFSELARLQPITQADRAQGFQNANGFVKSMYALRSYWLKQLGILRNQAYNTAKYGDKTGGLMRLASYLTVVAIGQQAFQALKDKGMGRDLKLEDYGVGGLMQLIGIPRYAVYRGKQIGVGTAAAETLIPGLGVLNDMGKDALLTAKYAAGTRGPDGGKTVPNLGTLLQNAETSKYIPMVGREIYSLLGAGKVKEQKERQRVMDGGAPRPSTLQEIKNYFVPPDSKSR